MMFKRILVLAPHIDDGELGCGGAVARFIEEGRDVFQVVFSAAVKSLPPGFPPDALVGEWKRASAVIGLPEKNLVRYEFPVRDFPAKRQEILEELVALRRELTPDLVLLPALEDIHQDHHTIAVEGVRAFKQVSIMGYELPWNNLNLKNNSFVALEEKYVKRKAEAMSCYHSQAHRNYCREDFIMSLARVRGAQIGVAWAELFSVIRLIVQ
jgi:LmbE family N-acetylglucosaminyl deacetylase